MTDLISNVRNNLSSKLRQPPPKLALFSAHDSTLHMLLASLGGDIFSNGDFWAPFASYFVIEVHDVIETKMEKKSSLFPTGKAFRLVFNGKVLTSKIEGCSGDGNGNGNENVELCDVSKLIQVLTPVAVSERSCDKLNNNNKDDKEWMKIVDGRIGVAASVGISIISGLLGSVLTFYYINRRLPFISSGVERRKYDSFDVANKSPAGTLPELPTIS